jgi:hypothetical protein
VTKTEMYKRLCGNTKRPTQGEFFLWLQQKEVMAEDKGYAKGYKQRTFDLGTILRTIY